MKSFFSTIMIASILGVGGVLWLGRGHFQNGGHVSRAIRETAAYSPPKGSPTPDAAPTASNQNEISDRDDVAKMRLAIEAANVAINFWGKVVDQDGVPLPGVRVAYTYSIHHGNDLGVAWIEQETRKGETTSDSDGSFAIRDLRGHDLTIESLTKGGYLHRERWPLTYNFHGDTPEGRFESRPDKPVRVTMIHNSAMESLIHVKGGVDVRGDGTAERWNLWSGEADPSGELAIIYRAELAVPANPAQRVNWSADLEIVGGGISEAPWDEDVRRAPESGYLPTIAYPKVEQKQGVPYRSFYVKTAEGKYGRVQVELSPSHDGRTARCFITSDMNPTPGSRNLEPAEEE